MRANCKNNLENNVSIAYSQSLPLFTQPNMQSQPSSNHSRAPSGT